MEKKEKIGNSKEKVESHLSNKFAKNVLILIIAQFAIKVLGLVYRVVLLNIDGFNDVANGYYSSGYDFYALLLTISSTGLPSVISKLVAEKVSVGDRKGAKRIFKIALKMFTGLGLLLSILLFAFADKISILAYNVEEVKYVLKVLAPAITFVSVSSIVRGYFTGLGDVKASSVSEVLQQFLNCILTILFTVLAIGRSEAIMAAAANLSTTIAVIISLSYLIYYYVSYQKREKLDMNVKSESDGLTDFQILKAILTFSIPVTIGALLGVVNMFIDSVTIAQGLQVAYSGFGRTASELKELAMQGKGLLSKAGTLVNMPQIITIGFTTMLVPTVSSLYALKKMKKMSKQVRDSFDAIILLTLPAYVGLAALAGPILSLLFPNASDGQNILFWMCLPGFIVSVNLILSSILQAVGKPMVTTIVISISVVMKYIINVALIKKPEINVYGSIISSVVSQLVVLIILYAYIKKHLGIKLINLNILLKISLASTLMGFFAYFSQKYLKLILRPSLATIVSMLTSMIVYAILILAFKIVNREKLEKMPGGNKIADVLCRLKLIA